MEVVFGRKSTYTISGSSPLTSRDEPLENTTDLMQLVALVDAVVYVSDESWGVVQ